MKKKIGLLISLIVIVGLIVGGIFLFKSNDTSTKYSLEEEQWIEKNKNQSIDIYMPSDIASITLAGEGLLFDYIDYLKKDVNLSFNPVAYTIGTEVNGEYAILLTDKVEKDDLVFLKENYTIISKDNIVINNETDLTNLKIGVLKSDYEEASKALPGITLIPYDTKDLLLAYFTQGLNINAMIGEKSLFLNDVLTNKYHYIYHISDMERYYVLKVNGEDKTLNKIIKKNFKKYSESTLKKDINKSLLNSYIKTNSLTDKDITNLNSKSYIYGYTDNGIYDYTNNGSLSGSNLEIIKNFAAFANIDMKYADEYKNLSKVNEALKNNKVDFYFNNNSIDDDKKVTVNSFNAKIAYLVRNDSKLDITSTNSLTNKEVYVIKNSKIEKYLKDLDIKVKSYDSYEELFNKKINKDSVIAIEFSNYEFYKSRYLNNYHVSYIDSNTLQYGFVLNEKNKLFNDLFAFYLEYNNTVNSIELLDNAVYKYEGINIFLVVAVIVLLIIVVIDFLAKIKMIIKDLLKRRKKGLSHEDKIKYIDQLTSLKNRAFLNDNITSWDESEIYPQIIIIIDLNNLAYINDNYGHEEGDKVITEAANILIQTQLPNSEIIRTDGNEFLIYMVEYEEKKAVSYIRKLKKEFKSLSHGYSAAIGYSIINDAIKTIDDAINEATLDMKTNKEIMMEEEK